MEFEVNIKTLKSVFIPEEFVEFGIQLLTAAPYDVRVLWCFGKHHKQKYASGPTEFMSLIWVPDEVFPVGVANHPLLRQTISENDSFHVWGEKAEEIRVAIEALKLNGRCITKIPRTEIGNSWEQTHALVYRGWPENQVKFRRTK